mgnify:CR=1 FL=1
MSEDTIKWSQSDMLEVTIKQPDDFLKVRETLTANDIERRNTITLLLQDWNLIEIVNTSLVENKAPLSQIKVLPFKEKGEWNMVAKYNIGKKPEDSNNASTTV